MHSGSSSPLGFRRLLVFDAVDQAQLDREALGFGSSPEFVGKKCTIPAQLRLDRRGSRQHSLGLRKYHRRRTFGAEKPRRNPLFKLTLELRYVV